MIKKINRITLLSSIIPLLGFLIVNNESWGVGRLWGIGLIGLEFVILAVLFLIKLKIASKNED